MRIFDSYSFNIVDKVRFQDTKPYINKMLNELGLSYSQLGFSLCSTEENEMLKNTLGGIIEKYPSMQKYSFSGKRSSDTVRFISSFSQNWREGDIYADKGDCNDVCSIFSKIPKLYNPSFCNMIFGGIDWFGSGCTDIAVDHRIKQGTHPVLKDPPFKSSRIMHIRDCEDGNKRNTIVVCIEVTDDPDPKDSRIIAEKLIPYLGEPLKFERNCIFPKDVMEKMHTLEVEHHKRMLAMADKVMPQHKISIGNSEPICHVADKVTLNRVFKGTGFKRQKSLHKKQHDYMDTDLHGFTYHADVEKLEGCNEFRVGFSVSGYNFGTGFMLDDYCVTEEGESSVILKKFAELCVKLRNEYSAELARDFGDTPQWYY